MNFLDFQIFSNISLPTLIATVLVLFLGIFYYALRDRRLPPGPWGLPYIGYWPFLDDDTAHIRLQQLMKKYGDVYSFTVAGKLFIHLGTFKTIKEAHVTKADYFANKYSDFSVLHFIYSEGIIAANGESWKMQRKLFVQAFREFGLTSFKDYMTGSIYDSMMSTVERLKAERGKPVNFFSTLSLGSSAILRRTMFNDEGITIDELNKLTEAYVKVISLFTNTKNMLMGEFARRVIFPLTADYKPAVENRKIMVDILKTIIKRHELTFDKGNIRDVIDFYIKERNERLSKNDPSAEYFTENSLISSLIEFVGDGILAVSIFTNHFFYALLDHPEEQDKIFKELEEVIGPDRQPTLDDKSKLPYTNAFIQEVLRTMDFFTITPSAECSSETTINGYKIPKGAVTMMNFWASHRDPNVFEDPDDFKPSRYLNVPGKQKPELPIIFGIGKRSCAGEAFVMMEVFLFLTTIVKNFHLTSPKGFNKKSFLFEGMGIFANPRK